MQAENVLLEPVVRFELAMPSGALARVTGELLRIGAQLDASETDGEETTLTGACTAAMFWDYPTKFAASTRGHGRIASWFYRYEPCKNQAEVVQKLGYDALADVQNPPGSVFCSPRRGFLRCVGSCPRLGALRGGGWRGGQWGATHAPAGN